MSEFRSGHDCRRRGAVLLWGLASAFLLSSCTSPIKVAYEAAPGVDFSHYRTYAWVTEDLMTGNDPLAAGYISQLDDQRVRKMVETQLDAKGMRKVPHDSADLALAFSVTREQKVKESIQPRTSVYYPSYSGGYDYGGAVTTVDVFTEGTLAFHFFDRETQEPVWAGWGSKRLSKSNEPPEVIEAAVQHILAKYPPPAR